MKKDILNHIELSEDPLDVVLPIDQIAEMEEHFKIWTPISLDD